LVGEVAGDGVFAFGLVGVAGAVLVGDAEGEGGVLASSEHPVISVNRVKAIPAVKDEIFNMVFKYLLDPTFQGDSLQKY
jgi:hypothetical protein